MPYAVVTLTFDPKTITVLSRAVGVVTAPPSGLHTSALAQNHPIVVCIGDRGATPQHALELLHSKARMSWPGLVPDIEAYMTKHYRYSFPRLRSSAPLAAEWGILSVEPSGPSRKDIHTLGLAEDPSIIIYCTVVERSEKIPGRPRISVTRQAAMPDVPWNEAEILGGTSFPEPEESEVDRALDMAKVACREHYALWQAAAPTFTLTPEPRGSRLPL